MRSPIEYEKGHIPNSINVPLFTNEARALVGTTFKEKGKQDALEIGLADVIPRIGYA